MAPVWLLAHLRLYDLMVLSYPPAQLHMPVHKISTCILNPLQIPCGYYIFMASYLLDNAEDT